MKTLQALRDDLAACLADIDGLAAVSKERELTDDESTKFDALLKQSQDLTASCDKAEAAEKAVADAREKLAYLNKPQRMAHSAQPTNLPKASPHFAAEQPKIEFPMRGRTRVFGQIAGLSATEAREKAHRFGIWGLAVLGNTKAQRYCAEHGIELLGADQIEGNNFQGGYLVPEEFDNDLIDLREQYGVFRRNARISPMARETKTRMRRTGGLTPYFVGEQDALTKSGKTWDQVPLVAKDLYVLDVYSGQLNADAAISVGDDLAGEIAYAFANTEDTCGFVGTGISSHGGIVGLKAKVTAATAGLATAASGTHTNWGNILAGSFDTMIGLLPQYADGANTKWYCHKTFWANVMARLAFAAGGNDKADLAGAAPKMFKGYPVEVSQVLPSSASTAEVVCFLGDLRLAADFGDRQGTAIAFSTDAVVGGVSMFETNQVAIRGWERFDINVHDVGNTSVAGPVVGLLTAS